MELTSEKSCCSAGNNQVDEQAGITQHRWQLSRRCYQQEYWSGLLVPSPGDLASSGMEPRSSASPILQVDALLLNHRGSYLEKVILDL